MDNSKMPYVVTKTLLGIKNELLCSTPAPFIPEHEYTINGKWGVEAHVEPTNKPQIMYVGIGIGGSRNIDDGNLSAPHGIRATDMDLYTPIPMRCVSVDNDLTAEERSNYRMRVKRSFNGHDYWCYYLKKIILTSTVRITKTNPDTLEEEVYDLDANGLTPTPPLPNATGTIVTDGNKINVSVKGEVELFGSDILESINVIYNDPRRANISEIGLYTGEDRIVNGEGVGGNTIQYMEAIYTQLSIKYTSIGVPFLTPDSYRKIPINLGKSNIMLI